LDIALEKPYLNIPGIGDSQTFKTEKDIKIYHIASAKMTDPKNVSTNKRNLIRRVRYMTVKLKSTQKSIASTNAELPYLSMR